MGTISVSLPSDGTTIDAADYNVPINTIVSTINGGLDSNNITAGGVVPNSLTSGAGTSWAWQSWTPTLSGRFTDADWTKACKYIQMGKTVFFRLFLTSTDATPMAGGAGTATFTLPVTSVDYGTASRQQIGQGILNDETGSTYPATSRWASTTTSDILTTGTTLASITSTAPFTWATSDTIYIQGFYEVP